MYGLRFQLPKHHRIMRSLNSVMEIHTFIQGGCILNVTELRWSVYATKHPALSCRSRNSGCVTKFEHKHVQQRRVHDGSLIVETFQLSFVWSGVDALVLSVGAKVEEKVADLRAR